MLRTNENLPALMPKFDRADVANARALAQFYGENVADKGRVPMVHLLVWHNALRPLVIDPKGTTGLGRGKHTGKRGGASTYELGGETKRATKQDARNARIWAIENNIDIPEKGRISKIVIQQWADMGAPIFENRELRATVYYVKRNHVTGNLYSKMHAVSVYADMLPARKPKSSEYVSCLDLPASAVVVRIVTANTLIDVTLDDNGEYVYQWVSKRDSKTVMNTLMSNLSLV